MRKWLNADYCRFAVAMCFMEDCRNYARQVDRALCEHLQPRNVFFDERFEAELARPDLNAFVYRNGPESYVEEIFSVQSALLVIVLGAKPKRSAWCHTTWDQIKRTMLWREKNTLVIRLTQQPTPDSISNIESVDAFGMSPHETARIILERLEIVRREATAGVSMAQSRQKTVLGPLVNVPRMPKHTVISCGLFEKVREAVLSGVNLPVCVVGAQSIAGLGRSTVAVALAHDDEIRRTFQDGIFWISLGMSGTDSTAHQTRLAQMLEFPEAVVRQATDDKDRLNAGVHPVRLAVFRDVSVGRKYLRRILWRKKCLIILDEVQDAAQIAAFDATGPHCAILATACDDSVIRGMRTIACAIPCLPSDDALRLLADESGMDTPDSLPPSAREIVRACNGIPMALSIIGEVVRQTRVGWDDMLSQLRAMDRDVIERLFQGCSDAELLRAIHVSVQTLDPETRKRYLSLAVFPENVPIPIELFDAMTTDSASAMSDGHSVLRRLAELGLICEPSEHQYMLHPAQFAYVRMLAQDLPVCHAWIIRYYADKCQDGWHTGPHDGYFFENLVHHLVQSGKTEEAKALLVDLRWLYAKLNATDRVAILTDYDRFRDDLQLRPVQEAIRCAGYVMLNDAGQLAGQLLARLDDAEAAPIDMLLDAASQYAQTPWLRPIASPLDAGDRFLWKVLDGHTSIIESFAFADGDRVVSCSGDRTVKVWDLQSGRVLWSLEGYEYPPCAVAVNPEGTVAVTWSCNKMLGWNLQKGCEVPVPGELQRRSENEFVQVTGRLAILCKIEYWTMLWDIWTGRLVMKLNDDGLGNDYASTPDGRLWFVLKLFPDRLDVWDLHQKRQLRTIEGFGGKPFVVTPDGNLAIDAKLNVWDVLRGEKLNQLDGVSGSVVALAVTPDGRRVIAASEIQERHCLDSIDVSLQVWDVKSGRKIATLGTESGWVRELRIMPDGKKVVSVSGTEDAGASGGWIKIWNMPPDSLDNEAGISAPKSSRRRGIRTADRHTDEVRVLAVTESGTQAISGAADGTFMVWDLESGRMIRAFGERTRILDVYECGRTIVHGSMMEITPDGRRAVSSLDDGSLGVWDTQSGQKVHSLVKYTDHAVLMYLTEDAEYVVSCHGSLTFKLGAWHLGSGKALCTPQNHKIYWDTCHVIYDEGRRAIVSTGGPCAMFKVMDIEQDLVLRQFGSDSGHSYVISVSRDGMRALVACEDGALQFWDLQSGTCVRTLKAMSEMEMPVALTQDWTKAITSDGRSGVMTVLDLEQGGTTGVLKGHLSCISCVVFTSDARRAVSAGMDKTLRVWDLITCRQLACYTVDAELKTCVVATDGRTCIAGDQRGQVHILRLEGTS